MNNGRSVRLFLVEGTPTGILTAEVVNWTEHILAAPRSKVETALKRAELTRTGIYILIGQDFETNLPKVYVGESDNISSRINTHSKDPEKDFWERFVAVTSKDLNLTKAHVKFLESKLITLLSEAKKARVINRTEPSFEKLPEADISDMEAFLEEIQLILPVIGIDVFRKTLSTSDNVGHETQRDKPTFEIKHKTKGINAKAVEIDGEFVVQAGSIGDNHATASFSQSIKDLRQLLIESGRLEITPSNKLKLTDNVAFSSPSAASVFLFGTSRNGRDDWKLKGQSLSYGQYKDSLLGDLAYE